MLLGSMQVTDGRRGRSVLEVGIVLQRPNLSRQTAAEAACQICFNGRENAGVLAVGNETTVVGEKKQALS